MVKQNKCFFSLVMKYNILFRQKMDITRQANVDTFAIWWGNSFCMWESQWWLVNTRTTGNAPPPPKDMDGGLQRSVVEKKTGNDESEMCLAK